MSIQIVQFFAEGGTVEVLQRPAAKALKCSTNLRALGAQCSSAPGTQGDDHYLLLSSANPEQAGKDGGPRGTFFASYESNPLPEAARPRIDARTEIYLARIDLDLRAPALKGLMEFSTLPDGSDLSELSEVAASMMIEAREQARAGVEHAVASRSNMEVIVDVKAPRIFVKSEATASDKRGPAATLLLDLGHLELTSDIKEAGGDTNKLSMAELDRLMYDDYPYAFQGIQILLLRPQDSASSLCAHESSPRHILPQTTINGVVSRCLRQNDTRLPGAKVSLTSKKVSLRLSDAKVAELALLMDRFSKGLGLDAKQGPSAPGKAPQLPSRPASMYLGTAAEASTAQQLRRLWGEEADDDYPASEDDADDSFYSCDEGDLENETPPPQRRLSRTEAGQPQESRTELLRRAKVVQSKVRLADIRLGIDALELVFSEQDPNSGTEIQLLTLQMHMLAAHVQVRPFDTEASASLSGISLQGVVGVEEDDRPYYLLYTCPQAMQGREVPDAQSIQRAILSGVEQAAVESDGESAGAFLQVSAVQCQRENPAFATSFDKKLLALKMDVSYLVVSLAQDELLDLMETLLPCVRRLQSRLQENLAQQKPPRVAQTQEKAELDSSGGHAWSAADLGVEEAGKKKDEGITSLAMDLAFGGVQLCLVKQGLRLSAMDLGGLKASVVRPRSSICPERLIVSFSWLSRASTFATQRSPSLMQLMPTVKPAFPRFFRVFYTDFLKTFTQLLISLFSSADFERRRN
jgi:hypothetical protein